MHGLQDSSRIFIITAAAEKGDLAAFQGSCGRTLTPTQAVKYVLKPLVTALQCMHAKHLLHRDIKPENMLLAADNTVQLCDFDLSIDAGVDSPTSRVCITHSFPCALSHSRKLSCTIHSQNTAAVIRLGSSQQSEYAWQPPLRCILTCPNIDFLAVCCHLFGSHACLCCAVAARCL